jgi:SAM-dependent methyltransferase
MTKPIQFDTVADLYDSYVTTNLDIPFFLDETFGFDDKILELMCGTGRVSIPLLEAGRKLCCVDYSEKMLDVFRNKISNSYPVRLIKMDVTNLDLKEKFGLILLPFHSLSEILSSKLQFKALKSITNHLRPGGSFICTLQNPTIRLQSADGELRKLGEFTIDDSRKVTVIYLNKFDKKTGIVSGFQQYEIYDNSHKLLDQRILEINFKPIWDSEFKNYLKNLDLEIISQYGDYNKTPFNENTSNFLIYKLIKQSTKA